MPFCNVINYNMRCIETSLYDQLIYEGFTDKLQHEMYWNLVTVAADAGAATDKLQHEMYWNLNKKTTKAVAAEINYNMRCIETQEVKVGLR